MVHSIRTSLHDSSAPKCEDAQVEEEVSRVRITLSTHICDHTLSLRNVPCPLIDEIG
jgi:hypothetical protein